MRNVVRFLVFLISGLALLVLVAYVALADRTHAWWNADIASRAQVAVESARSGLARHWGDPDALAPILADMARGDHIRAAAACVPSGEVVASTADFMTLGPGSCDPDAETLQDASSAPAFRTTATRLERDGRVFGSVLLVHDLADLRHRERSLRVLALIGLVVLAAGAIGTTLIATRIAWRGWTGELRSALAGNPSRAFLPLVREVRMVADQVADDTHDDKVRGGMWGPERLRAALREHLRGERIVLLANREPYVHEQTAEGIRVQHPASGLVTALEPVLRACSGVWVAHGSGSADRLTVDEHDLVRVPPGEESYQIKRVWLTEEEEAGYYYGFSNEGLWPLCHVAHTRPTFRASDWAQYVRVNQRFADAVCEQVDVDDPVVLVQDYHFALAPKMIRQKLPRATILTFWHIPWPSAERVGICPWGEELISGMLGSSILGFHTQQHCNNFIDSVDAFVESRIDRETNAIVKGRNRTLVRPYPISIEWPVRWLAGAPSVAECRAEVRRELDLPADALLGVGIDRLDYTKGIEERLAAVDSLLERYPEYRGRFTFAQLAAPSRTRIVHYRDLNDRVEALSAEINARWASGSYRPIALLRAHHEPAQVFRYYRAADLCYVSSLDDGMNLVAKEFAAARDDERGVLVLSQFTGAARDLTEALIVNPYDLQQASDALAMALRMAPQEQRERMRSMRRVVAEHNVYRWAGRMLVDAASLRRRERLFGRLAIFNGAAS
ncbi:MAG: trehalose-6-phosphate synthase [Deltaproteobacteria bacterium]|nr:trehalose-6-phosphate synthase [Deltaproteobacteria bacterium]